MEDRYATIAEYDPKLYGDHLNTYMNQQSKPKKPLYTTEQAKGFGLTPSEESALLSIQDPDKQEKYVDNLMSKRSAGVQAEGLDIKKSDAAIRERKEVQTQRSAFTGAFNKIEADLQKEERALLNVKDAIKRGDNASDAIVFNWVARAVANEKGPLNEGDIQRLKNETFEGKAEQFSNWLKGGTITNLTEAQRKSFADIVGAAEKRFGDYKSERIHDVVGRASIDQPLLFDESGAPDKAISVRAEKYGLEHKGGGAFERKATKTTEISGDYAAPAASAGKISDPKLKSQALDAIKSYQSAGKPVPQATLDMIKKAAGE
jgi:hypothetical protein